MATHPLSGINIFVSYSFLFFYLVKRKPGKTHITIYFHVAAMSVLVLFFIWLDVGMKNVIIYSWDIVF